MPRSRRRSSGPDGRPRVARPEPDWTLSHVRMFEYFGGAPELVIPDNEEEA